MAKQINLNQISLNQMVTGENRHQFLGKTVKGYLDSTGYQEFTVEDTYPDTVLSGIVVLHREENGVAERRFGILFSDGFAIVLSGESTPAESFTIDSLELYKVWLSKLQAPKLDFDCGIEIRVSKELLRKLKAPLKEISNKLRSYEGMFGRLKEAKPLKAFQANDKGCIRTALEDNVVTVKIDTRAVMFVVDLAVDYTDYCCRKAAALMALLDFSDLLYRVKEKSDRFKKEVEDALK